MYDYIKFRTDIISVKRIGITHKQYFLIIARRYVDDGYYEAHIKPCKNLAHKKRLHAWIFVRNPVTVLNTCSKCGKTSIPRQVHHRSNLHGLWKMVYKEIGEIYLYVNRESYENIDMLCMGCWNVWRAISKKYDQAEDLRLFINRVNRELRNERKNCYNGTASRVSC